jgi:choline kinase
MNDNVLQVSHVLPTFNAIDCGIYLLQNSIFQTIENCLEQGKNSLPLIITELAIQGKFKTHNIGEHEVVDIDREKDVEYIQNKEC